MTIRRWKAACAALAAALAGWAAEPPLRAAQAATDARAVIDTYADIAQAGYEDSLAAARALASAVADMLAAPGAATHADAKAAWIAARPAYQQTEAWRFGNPIVDEWEGRVNAWPLDEGLIDYVDGGAYGESGDNGFYTANIVANPSLTAGGRTIDASTIDPALIRSLHEIDEVEANVATGYHAIEFLLWGQDLNGTGPGAGARPWTDYAAGEACTGGNCDRRGAYLTAAAELLVADLEEMAANWAPGGRARAALERGTEEAGLAAIVTGLGSLSYGELAGERMRLGLLLHDPEEEHDCFSDNTHNSHYYNIVGILNAYAGRYEGAGGRTVEGPGLSALVREHDPALDAAIRARLDETLAAAGRLKATADRGEMAYDRMIGEGNEEGNALVQAVVDALVAQTAEIGRIAPALGLRALAFEGSDSLDNPEAVFE